VSAPRKQAYDRWFLLGEKRSQPLALWEVQQYGRDSFGDPEYVSIYGLRPDEWYARGVRIPGRTAVECTRDQLASLIGHDIAIAARAAPVDSVMVADLFAGSGNTLYWIKRHTGAARAVGFEVDDTVFELASANVSTLGLGIDLRHDGYRHGLQTLPHLGEDLLIVFVAPPWGQALSEVSGLDLRRTRPPVAEVINVTIDLLGDRKLLFAVQVYETVEPDSLADLTDQFPWSATIVYDINAPGQNHGLLLAAWGWVQHSQGQHGALDVRPQKREQRRRGSFPNR
jgi:16S rRNA G966 N2-methylase RsmD